VGTVNLPTKALKLLISAEAGASATGTVWFDSFIFKGRVDWAGQNWNGFVDASQGWQYWIAPNGGNDAKSLFGASGVTDEQAHNGTYSLKMTADVGRDDGECVFFTETIPIPLNSMGKKYMLHAECLDEDRQHYCGLGVQCGEPAGIHLDMAHEDVRRRRWMERGGGSRLPVCAQR
jgi:hypothetical protein